MTWITPETADATICPFARTFAATPAQTGCRGPTCALWRWEKVTTAHPAYRDAVRAVAATVEDKPPFPKAARIVADDPEKYGLVPSKGYCGAGGQP